MRVKLDLPDQPGYVEFVCTEPPPVGVTLRLPGDVCVSSGGRAAPFGCAVGHSSRTGASNVD